MAALKKGVEPGLHRRTLENTLSSGLVPNFPVKDMIVLLLAIVAENRRAGLERLPGIDQHGELFVFHFHKLGSVGGGVAVFSDHEGHFLRLKENFAGGQDHLFVAGQRGHQARPALDRSSPLMTASTPGSFFAFSVFTLTRRAWA